MTRRINVRSGGGLRDRCRPFRRPPLFAATSRRRWRAFGRWSARRSMGTRIPAPRFPSAWCNSAPTPAWNRGTAARPTIIPIRTILGFSHTHLSGTGCSDLGDIRFTPAQRQDSEDGKGRLPLQVFAQGRSRSAGLLQRHAAGPEDRGRTDRHAPRRIPQVHVSRRRRRPAGSRSRPGLPGRADRERRQRREATR